MSTLNPPLGERDHLRGPLDAPLQLVEFGDFECPYCREAYPNVKGVEQVLGRRLCLGFRHFPLAPLHPHAVQAAEAAEAAGAQGRFWEMHDLLFENQDSLEVPDLIEYANALELDIDRFLDELRTHEHVARIRADLRSGSLSGVKGTPTFFVNGVRHDGAYDYESLLAALGLAAGATVEP